MPNRFVRKSHYRHVFGKCDKEVFSDLRSNESGNNKNLATNGKYVTCPLRGGGGPIVVLDVSKRGRIDNKRQSSNTINVHRGRVTDVSFYPFDQRTLATGSEDCMVSITQIPEDGMNGIINKPLCTLDGHTKKITQLAWHPTSSNVLTSCSYDGNLRIWDVEAQFSKISYESEDEISTFSWNDDGSMVGLATKRKNEAVVTMLDPRTPDAAMSWKAHRKAKRPHIIFMEKIGKICTVGLRPPAQKQIAIWDPKMLSEPVTKCDIGSSAGVSFPYYDRDNSILYIAAKGDSTINYWEVDNQDPFLHHLSGYRDGHTTKGICWYPKRMCTTTKCEIAFCMRLSNKNTIDPISFMVPRKSQMFAKDLYPDAYSGQPSQTAVSYFAGKNANPVCESMNPKDTEKNQSTRQKVSLGGSSKELDELKAQMEESTKTIAAKDKLIKEQSDKISAQDAEIVILKAECDRLKQLTIG